jgi:hypothetical protein
VVEDARTAARDNIYCHKLASTSLYMRRRVSTLDDSISACLMQNVQWTDFDDARL